MTIQEELQHVKEVYGSNTLAYNVALRAQVILKAQELEIATLKGKSIIDAFLEK